MHRSFASRYKAGLGKHCSGARSRMTKGRGYRLEQTATLQLKKVTGSQDDKKGGGYRLAQQRRCNCKKSQSSQSDGGESSVLKRQDKVANYQSHSLSEFLLVDGILVSGFLEFDGNFVGWLVDVEVLTVSSEPVRNDLDAHFSVGNTHD